jgi:transcriptional regulator with XRE-family HTH domain
MAKKTAPLLPSTDELLRQFAARLRVARLRRRLSAKQVAERAGMSPMTLRSLERGGSGVTMGAYLAVMQTLGIENDLELLGNVDPVGRELQDARLPARLEAARPSPPPVKRPTMRASTDIAPKTPRPSGETRNWISRSGFASAEALAGLIDPPPPLAKKRR